MAPRLRADAELVRRKLARSREHAAELIKTGRVTCNGMPVKKPASIVDPNAALVVEDLDEFKWASRGAHKLLGALEAFGPQGLTVAGKRCLDAGASTGGFTDVLLAHDAAHVIGVDVGYGQMVWRLQSDPRVTVLDRTNVRSISADTLGGPVDLVVSDLSFISLTLVLEALLACCTQDAQMMLMVKPQFEVGKHNVGAGGVVRDPAQRRSAICQVAQRALELGMGIRDIAASPLPGPSGNVEYFLWIEAHPSPDTTLIPGAGPDQQQGNPPLCILGTNEKALSELAALAASAVEKGPQ